MLLEIIIFMRGDPKLGTFEGVGNENQVKIFNENQVKIFIAHPFKWAALWVFPHKNNYIPQHLNNRCINS
jgi:hypothetical protein